MRVSGEIRVPGDKSISHRALMCAVLAGGTSRIRGILDAADVRSTAWVLRVCGGEVPHLGPSIPEISIRGLGLRALRAPAAALDCGNSGTTARLMSGICAGHPFRSHLVGDASLSRRPMRRVAEPLRAMGAKVQLHGHGDDALPMTIDGGNLSGLEWRTESASAQVKSAILLAGLVASVPVTVHEPARSRDHTERMLAALGVSLRVEGTSVTLAPAAALAPLDLAVPGDPSSAAFMAAVAALSQGGTLTMPNICLNETRTGFYRVLRRMGARVEHPDAGTVAGEPVGSVQVTGGTALRGVEVGSDEVPSLIDELPLLACLGARAAGETVITGAAELRVKESDRISAVAENLRQLGVEVEELPDGLRVRGSDRPLAGHVSTRGDHRLAMAFGVLAALPGNRIDVAHREIVDVSYPGYWADLARVTAG